MIGLVDIHFPDGRGKDRFVERSKFDALSVIVGIGELVLLPQFQLVKGILLHARDRYFAARQTARGGSYAHVGSAFGKGGDLALLIYVKKIGIVGKEGELFVLLADCRKLNAASRL